MEPSWRWSKAWKIAVPEHVRCFVWLTMHGRLLTNQHKHRLGLGEPFCRHCIGFLESVLHVPHDNPGAVNMWNHWIPTSLRVQFYMGDLEQWIEINFIVNIIVLDGVSWDAMWATACYSLWQSRNTENHVEGFVRPSFPWNVVQQRVQNFMVA